MIDLADRLECMGRLSPAERAAALIPVLPDAEPDELPLFCRELIRTGRADALAAVVTHLHRIDPARRDALRTAGPLGASLFEPLLLSRNARTRKNLVDLVALRAEPAHASLLQSAITHEEPDLAARAAGALLTLVAAAVGERGQRRPAGPVLHGLDEVVCDALERYREHRCRDVILAAAILLHRPGARLRALLDNDPAGHALAIRSTPNELERSIVRKNLIPWLKHGLLAPAVLRSFKSWSSPAYWSDLLEPGHLLRHPARRRALRRLSRPERCAPDPGVLVQLGESTQHRVVDWAQALGVTSTMRTAMLRDLLAAPSPLARLKAARALASGASLGDQAATSTLRLFMFDRDSAVAGLAARERAALSEPVIRSELASRAHGAQCLLRRAATEDLMNLRAALDRLSPGEREFAASLHAHRDRNAMLTWLRELLCLPGRDAALMALGLAARLRLEVELEEAIIECAGRDDAYVSARAATVLGRLTSEPARKRLDGLLTHADARVRANAIEAAGRHLARDGAIERFQVERSNRPRANLLRVLCRVAPERGREEVVHMLRDPRPLHRISAIWVARREVQPSCLAELKQVADRDGVSEIRVRAAHAARFISRAMQARPRPGSARPERRCEEVRAWN